MKPVLQVLLLVSALLPASVATRAQPQRDAEEIGLSGYVLAPDGTPVSSGSVLIQSPAARASASIERTGRFRLIPNVPGVHQISVSVSGLAPYRVNVTVPPSRTLRLPMIRLSPATYFRARFVSAGGEPITAARLTRHSLDVSGMPVIYTPDDRTADPIDRDGTITIGPLPRGITMLALNSPLFAQTRLRDLHVTGGETLLDGGTVVVQPGAVLHVDVVDETGAPVPQHVVSIEDVRSPSPLSFTPARTNHLGRATFDRLAPGRYRLRARVVGYCGNRMLSVARLVSVGGSGTLLTRLVIGGRATFRLTSAFGPLRGISVSASPDSGPPAPPAWLRSRSDVPAFAGRPMGPFTFQTSCVGFTDEDGRVTLNNFPPGPARVDVQLRNSTYVRQVDVPDGLRAIAIAIPDGFLPLHLTHAITNEPVTTAAITWTGGGARVEAKASGNGDALLEGMDPTGGTLAITASGYEPAELKLSEPTTIVQELALMPAPATSLRPRVITTSGEPVPNAVVELLPANPIEAGHVAVADAKGFVSFSDVPPGALRLVASADRFVTAAMQVAGDSRSDIVLTLSPGYRVIAIVESSAEPGPHLVRVVNEAGASMEGLLDTASDRSIEPPGRISLGPLAPGTYVVELLGPREHRQERVRIVDRDIIATFR